MNLRTLLDPRYGLWIIVPAAFSVTVAIWFLQDAYALDLSLFLNLSTAASTALLGAGIAMWIYRHLTLESQDRRFRHDLEVRHFEDIYGPLYEEMSKLVKGLREYDAPMAQFWEEMKRGRFGPFVDPTITRELNVPKKRTRYPRETCSREWVGRSAAGNPSHRGPPHNQEALSR